MARYDQGGGCACGLERWCSCGSGQANGRTVEADRKASGYFKTSDGGWRKDRSDPEGGIPGRDLRDEPIIECFDRREV